MSLNEKYFNIIDMIENTILVLQPALNEKYHNFSFNYENVTHVNVFVPFERAANPNISASEGSGLGMSISKKSLDKPRLSLQIAK